MRQVSTGRGRSRPVAIAGQARLTGGMLALSELDFGLLAVSVDQIQFSAKRCNVVTQKNVKKTVRWADMSCLPLARHHLVLWLCYLRMLPQNDQIPTYILLTILMGNAFLLHCLSF